MKYLLIIILATTIFTGCERYQKMQDYVVQDRWTGKLYLITDGKLQPLEVAAP